METIQVKGMSCGFCQKAVKKMISEIEGVEQVNVSLKDENASFELINNTSVEEVLTIVNESHYEASL